MYMHDPIQSKQSKAIALLSVLSLTGQAAAAAESKPNVVYIMCDDMGYGDLGCY